MTATVSASAAAGPHPAGPPPINYAASIASLITRRQAQLDYLQRVHAGQTLYLNTTLLTPATLPTTLPPKHIRQRITHYLLLGLSLGRLVAVTDASLLLYSMSAVLDEFLHFTSHTTSGDVSYYYQADTIHHTLHVPPHSLTQPPLAASAFPVRSHRQTLYTYLLLPPSLSAPPSTSSAASLSHPLLLTSLLSLLSRHYTALLSLPATAASYAYVVAVDRRLVAVVVAPLLADMTTASLAAVKVAVDGLKESGGSSKADSSEWVKVEAGSSSGSISSSSSSSDSSSSSSSSSSNSSSSGGGRGGSSGLGGVDFGAITAMTSVFNAGAMSAASEGETSASDVN